MFQRLIKNNYLETLKEQSEEIIRSDRQKYAPILKITFEYCQKKKVYLDLPQLYLDKNFDVKEAIEKGYIEKLELYTPEPQKVAKEIATQICKKVGNDLDLSVIFEKKEYLIQYDTRKYIIIYEITGEVPEIRAGKLYLFPLILEQINILSNLVDVSQFDSWPDLLQKFQIYNKLIKFDSIVEQKPDSKKLQDIRTLLLKYFENTKHILLSDSVDQPLHIISINNVTDVVTEITVYLDKYTNLGVYYKNANFNLPKQTQFDKNSVFISNEGRPIAHIYNLANYMLVPNTCIKDCKLRIAAPVVQTFIHLINIWMNYNNDKCIRKTDYDAYMKYIDQIKIEKFTICGTYVDPVVKKKMDRLAMRKFSSERSRYNCEELI